MASPLDAIHAALDYLLPTPTPEEEAAARLEDHLRQGAVIQIKTPSEFDESGALVAMKEPVEPDYQCGGPYGQTFCHE